MTTFGPTKLESDANARVKRWRRLAREARMVRREGATLLEGIHLLETVLAVPDAAVEAVLLSSDATDEALALAAQFANRGVRLFEAPRALYDTVSPVENGVGVMCEVRLPAAPEPEAWASQDLLYLDGVQDAGNAGTLIRTAAAAGFRTVAASPGTAALWTPKVMRAGMGAHFGVRIVENLAHEDLKRLYSGAIIAADARGGEDLFAAADYSSGPVCWVMGAEGPGVSESLLALCDRRFYIPIEPACESLNVGAAAAVCLFDVRRRRRTR